MYIYEFLYTFYGKIIFGIMLLLYLILLILGIWLLIKIGLNKEKNDNEINNKIAIAKKTIIIISILLAVIIIYIFLILLIYKIEWSTKEVNETLNEMEDGFYKRTIMENFKIEDDAYIEKITYSKGFDNGNIWDFCVYYNYKIECSEGPFDTQDYYRTESN